MTRSPYPGLRPFERDESDVFFGRARQVDGMLAQLQHNRFLAVTGASGAGKSSLVRTGLYAALEMGLMRKAGSHWRIVEFRPQSDPMAALSAALTDQLEGPGEDADRDRAIGFTRAHLERGPEAIVEIARAALRGRDEAMLLVVDQFEELFRFKGVARDDDHAFVQLLLAAQRQAEVPIYVVLTMRSDYLGECARYEGLAETVNHALYLTPRLSREDLRDSIAGPARVFGGDVEPGLIARILNDIEGKDDQLPLVQHALAWLWQRASRAGEAAPLLTLADYIAIGGIDGALSQHANAIVDELVRSGGTSRERTIEKLFSQLLEPSAVGNDVRRPTPLARLAAVADAGEADIRAIIEAFRAPGRNFLTPGPGHALSPGTTIDISHESLIRHWDRLRSWADKERAAQDEFRRIRDGAVRHKAGKSGLLYPPDLGTASKWWEDAQPSQAWAENYGGGHAEAAAYLRESKAAHRRSWWTRIAGAVAVVAVLAVGGGFYRYEQIKAEAEAAIIDQNAAREREENDQRMQIAQARADALAEQNALIEVERSKAVAGQNAANEARQKLAEQNAQIEAARGAAVAGQDAAVKAREALAEQNDLIEAARSAAVAGQTAAVKARQALAEQNAQIAAERQKAVEGQQKAETARKELAEWQALATRSQLKILLDRAEKSLDDGKLGEAHAWALEAHNYAAGLKPTGDGKGRPSQGDEARLTNVLIAAAQPEPRRALDVRGSLVAPETASGAISRRHYLAIERDGSTAPATSAPASAAAEAGVSSRAASQPAARLVVFDTASGRPVATAPLGAGQGGEDAVMALEPFGGHVAVAVGGQLHVGRWRADTAELTLDPAVAAPPGMVAMSLSEGENPTLAVLTRDNAVHLSARAQGWRLDKLDLGAGAQTLRGKGGARGQAIAIDPGGGRLAVVTDEGGLIAGEIRDRRFVSAAAGVVSMIGTDQRFLIGFHQPGDGPPALLILRADCLVHLDWTGLPRFLKEAPRGNCGEGVVLDGWQYRGVLIDRRVGRFSFIERNARELSVAGRDDGNLKTSVEENLDSSERLVAAEPGGGWLVVQDRARRYLIQKRGAQARSLPEARLPCPRAAACRLFAELADGSYVVSFNAQDGTNLARVTFGSDGVLRMGVPVALEAGSTTTVPARRRFASGEPGSKGHGFSLVATLPKSASLLIARDEAKPDKLLRIDLDPAANPEQRLEELALRWTSEAAPPSEPLTESAGAREVDGLQLYSVKGWPLGLLPARPSRILAHHERSGRVAWVTAANPATVRLGAVGGERVEPEETRRLPRDVLGLRFDAVSGDLLIVTDRDLHHWAMSGKDRRELRPAAGTVRKRDSLRQASAGWADRVVVKNDVALTLDDDPARLVAHIPLDQGSEPSQAFMTLPAAPADATSIAIGARHVLLFGKTILAVPTPVATPVGQARMRGLASSETRLPFGEIARARILPDALANRLAQRFGDWPCAKAIEAAARDDAPVQRGCVEAVRENVGSAVTLLAHARALRDAADLGDGGKDGERSQFADAALLAAAASGHPPALRDLADRLAPGADRTEGLLAANWTSVAALADAIVARGGRLPSAIIELVSREPERGPDREQHMAWRQRIADRRFDGEPVAEIARVLVAKPDSAAMLAAFDKIASTMSTADDGGALRAMHRRIAPLLDADHLGEAVARTTEALLAAENKDPIGPDRPAEQPDPRLVAALVTDTALKADAFPAEALGEAERKVALLIGQVVPTLAPQQALRAALTERLVGADDAVRRVIADVIDGQESTPDALRGAVTKLQQLNRNDLAAIVAAEWLRNAASRVQWNADDIRVVLASVRKAVEAKEIQLTTLGAIYRPSILKDLRDAGERLNSRARDATDLNSDDRENLRVSTVALMQAAVDLEELVRPRDHPDADLDIRSRAYNLLDRMLARQVVTPDRDAANALRAIELAASRQALDLLLAAKSRNQRPRGGDSSAVYTNNVGNVFLRYNNLAEARPLVYQALDAVLARMADPELEPDGDLFWSIEGISGNMRTETDKSVVSISSMLRILAELPAERLAKGNSIYLGSILRNVAYVIVIEAGRRNLIQFSPQADACDTSAAHPYDPIRVAPAVVFEALNVAEAVKACETAVRRSPREARFSLQLGRALERRAELGGDRNDDVLNTRYAKSYKQAVDQKYPVAFNNYANLVQSKDSNEYLEKHTYYYNRTISHLGERLAVSLEAEGGEPNWRTAAWLRAEHAAARQRPETHRLVERWRQAK